MAYFFALGIDKICVDATHELLSQYTRELIQKTHVLYPLTYACHQHIRKHNKQQCTLFFPLTKQIFSVL